MNKVVVVCNNEHEKGYEDYVGVCLLCEIEKFKNREWVGLTKEDLQEFAKEAPSLEELCILVEAKLKEKNNG